MVIAAVDQRNGGLYYWWQPNGSTEWHQQTVAAGPPGCCADGSLVNGVTKLYTRGYSKPSIAWTGKSVVIAATDKNGLHYWFQEKGTTTWHHELVYRYISSSGPSGPAPAIAWTGTSVVIADPCQANNGYGLCYYWESAGSNVWHRESVQLAGNVSNPSIAWTGSAVVIAAVEYADPNKSASTVAYYWQPPGTTKWQKQQVGTALEQFTPPALASAGGSVVVAAVDTTRMQQRLDYWWAPATGNGAWTQQNPPGPVQYSGLTSQGGIAWTGVSVVLATTDACGDLDFWWQQFGSSTWHKERVVTGPWPPGTC